MSRQTNTSIEKLRNKLAKIGAPVKTTHIESPKGKKIEYEAAIMKALEYCKQVTN